MRSQLARRVDRPCSADPQQLTSLAEVLGRIPDPRRVRGRRYRLNSLLALCLVAVLGGATSLAAIARFAADTHPGLREQLELASSTPNASTLGRLLARLNGDALDDAEGAWLARYAAAPVDEGGDTLAGLAVDGQPVRGSRADGAAVHLLAAALHSCQTVIAQRIPSSAPLLDQINLHGVVVTADALHTQRTHAEHLITTGGHYLLVVKGNQKKPRKQRRHLPWRQIPLQARTTGAGHGRREVRRLKVCTVRPGLLFPHAVQAMEIRRRRTNHKTGKAETKTVYAVTSLPPEQAGPARLAELVRSHRSVEALYHVRDLTYGERRLASTHWHRTPRHGHPAQPRHRTHRPCSTRPASQELQIPEFAARFFQCGEHSPVGPADDESPTRVSAVMRVVTDRNTRRELHGQRCCEEAELLTTNIQRGHTVDKRPVPTFLPDDVQACRFPLPLRR
ncbi:MULTISPECIES: ISAs1 family transposase [unclassified Streptomyces]|uniref:ISAs1 family transposase n=1 Tax=unclassified Streptomyces TaxID=2593676 RepID=UPI000DD9E4F4|nr:MULTISPECIES: ISAs1 family transposase [unclassified Streptomyces]QZZ25715.1 ISAs1 family transposase [Streptomyces sp. ST1015]